METVELVFVFVHLLGMAAIVGGYFGGITPATKRLSAGITHGALLQIVSGAVLLGLAEAANDPTDPVNHAKFGVKIAIVTVIMFLAWPRRRATSLPNGIYHAIGLLAITNVAIAVFWK